MSNSFIRALVFVQLVVIVIHDTFYFWLLRYNEALHNQYLGITEISKIQLVVYYQCCVLIG